MSLRLHIIGSGCPTPTAKRYGSAFMLETDDRAVLIDCGPATTYKMACMGLDPRRVDTVFLTHHHFDHNADFACFALSRWDQSRGTEPPLAVIGPPPTQAFVKAQLGPQGAFAVDWNARIKHPASCYLHRQRGGVMPRPAPAVQAQDVGPGTIAANRGWTVTADRVDHVEPTMTSLAFRFETGQGSIVFAGDCADCPELRALARGANTLVIACAHFGPTEVDPALSDVITGTPETADIARETGVGRVVLTHMSPAFNTTAVKERAIADVGRTYQGLILAPDELTSLELS